MATRGSALQRALKYFREADIDEMRVAFTLAKEIVERRLAAASQVAPNPARVKRTRTRKASPPGGLDGTAVASSQHETLADA